jgi:hypothetical protein
MARTHLQSQLEYTPIAFKLLPTQFPLAAVHHVYEQILGEVLDGDTFQRILLAADVLISVPGHSQQLFSINPNLSADQFILRWREARQSMA